MKLHLFALIVTCLSSTLVVGQKRLELNLQQGQTYTQVTNSNATIVQDLMGQQLEILIGLEGTMLFEVLKANSDSYDMSVTFGRLRMSMGSQQGSTTFDSNDPAEDDAYSQVLSNIIGQSFNLVMSKNGKVQQIENLDRVWEAALADRDVTASERQQILNQLNQTYGAKAMKGNIEMVTAIFPDGPVNPGDTWRTEADLNAGMEGRITTQYSFDGQEADHYLLTGRGNIETVNKDQYINTNGLDLKFDMSGTVDSQVKVDRSSGWISTATIVQSIEGKADMKANEQMPNGLSIPMKIKSELNITDR